MRAFLTHASWVFVNLSSKGWKLAQGTFFLVPESKLLNVFFPNNSLINCLVVKESSVFINTFPSWTLQKDYIMP